MKIQSNFVRKLGVLIFSVGVLVGMALFGGLTWANLEADFYFGYGIQADEPLKTMKCPLILSTSETGTVTASLTNTTQRLVEPAVQSDISYIGVMRTARIKPSIAPGDTQLLQWAVTSDDMVFKHLILVKVFVFSTFTLPSRDGTCGILMLDLFRLTGSQIFYFALVVSLLCMAVGIGMKISSNPPLDRLAPDATRAMIFLAIIVLVGIFVSVMGRWGAGVIAFALAVLMIGVMTRYIVSP